MIIKGRNKFLKIYEVNTFISVLLNIQMTVIIHMAIGIFDTHERTISLLKFRGNRKILEVNYQYY